jgi:hypothetical protein
MRGKLALSLLLAGLVVAVTVAIDGASASGGTSIHVLVHGNTIKGAFFDKDNNGPTLGDRASGRGPLVDSVTGEHVGSSYSDCWVARQQIRGKGFWDCTYLLKLAGGTITLQGLDPHGSGSSPFAVTGGTGVYKDARGDAVFTDTDLDTDMQISLTD